jgi:hypothetical protein
MKTGTARYAKHYEIAAYGESAVRWGYNHWWSKTFLLGFSAHTFINLGRTTKADIACGWGLTEGARSDIRYRNITPKGLSQNKEARINPKSSLFSHSSPALRHPSPQGNPSSYSPSNKALKLCYPLPSDSAHATNAQSFKQRTAWEIASGWDGHLCAAKVKELNSGRAICVVGQGRMCRQGHINRHYPLSTAFPSSKRFSRRTFDENRLFLVTRCHTAATPQPTHNLENNTRPLAGE